MPNIVSPDVYIIEKDISEYAPTVNSSVVGLVGFASKGEENKATLITSPQQLVETFGKPAEAIYGQGLEGAVEILETTNSIYYVRAASGASDAAVSVPLGHGPVVAVSGSDWGVGTDLYLKVQVYNNAGTKQFTGTGKSFAIPAGTGTDQHTALRSVLGGGLDSSPFGVYQESGGSSLIIGSHAGSGSYMDISTYDDSTYTTGAYAMGRPDETDGTATTAASALRVYGATIHSDQSTCSVSYRVQTIHPGAGYNAGVSPDGTTSGNSIEINELGGANFQVQVNENGSAKEQFKASFASAIGTFIEDVINTGETSLTSDIIKGNLVVSSTFIDFTPTPYASGLANRLEELNIDQLTGSWKRVTVGTNLFNNTATTVTAATTTHTGQTNNYGNKLVAGSYNLAGGDNGVPADSAGKTAALVGDATVEPKTGMQSLDDDVLNISVAAIPGVAIEAVQNALIALAESTQNFLAVVAPPYGNGTGTAQDAIDWSNGLATTRTSAINNSYAAIYWPWVKSFSVFDGKDLWLDPAIFGIRQMAFTDNVGETWFAPAGFQRGRLTKPTEVEAKLTKGERDSLYSGGNVINPIVDFPQQGITIFGQRTTQREPTALDRINIRRLMIFLRKVILLATRRFVFEPNDQFTWSQIEGVLNPFLNDIVQRRGITEFRVVCDATTNTPTRVDRNELWCKVLLKPTKTAEMLVFEVNLTNQSAKLGNL